MKRVDVPMLAINLLVVVLLLCSYAGAYISPETFWPLALVVMGYPVLLLLTAAFAVYWMFRKNWILYLNIGAVLLQYHHAEGAYGFSRSAENESMTDSDIRVMSYNVRLFDYYNWSKNKRTRDSIYGIINDFTPDILCIQEFYHDNTGYFPTKEPLLEGTELRHMHVHNYVNKLDEKQLWGMATLSRYPIIGKDAIIFDRSFGNLCMITDVRMGDDTVRIYNLHLQSIRLNNHDKNMIDDMLKKQKTPDLKDSRSIMSQMINGFQMRARQAEQVAEHIRSSPYPVILCGDFNDVPTSYAYRTISTGLHDSFVAKGKGLGGTYVLVPFFRIDNIFHSDGFNTLKHTTHPEALSDHLAVSCVLRKE